LVAREIDLTLVDNINDLGYRIELSQSISLSQGTVWSARISRRGWTKAGNEAKPQHVITLVHEDDPIELLRQVAELFREGLTGPVPLEDGAAS
jgi:hypothetical protein